MARNRALALAARDAICRARGIPPPCPDDCLGSMASFPLPDGTGPEPRGASLGRDPLQEDLYSRHRIEVPIFSWPRWPKRLIRIRPSFTTPCRSTNGSPPSSEVSRAHYERIPRGRVRQRQKATRLHSLRYRSCLPLGLKSLPSGQEEGDLADYFADREGLSGAARARFLRLLSQSLGVGRSTRESGRRALCAGAAVMGLVCLGLDYWAHRGGVSTWLIVAWAACACAGAGLGLAHRRVELRTPEPSLDIHWRVYCLLIRPIILVEQPGLLDRNLKDDCSEAAARGPGRWPRCAAWSRSGAPTSGGHR